MISGLRVDLTFWKDVVVQTSNFIYKENIFILYKHNYKIIPGSAIRITDTEADSFIRILKVQISQYG